MSAGASSGASTRRRRAAGGSGVGALVALLVLASCGEPPRGPGARLELRVAAAASLSDAFAEIERAFEAAHPEVDVVLNLAASSALREQILGGAPVDVFAAADRASLEPVAAAGLVYGATRVFARNRLQIAVPAGNPAAVTGLADFADAERLIGLCAAGVPCGDYARRALAQAGVVAAIDTAEPNARALLTKLEAGELDAGIVYATDVAASRAVEGIDLPAAVDAVVEYPIVVLAGGPNPRGARAFVAFVHSAEGRRLLRDHGFLEP